MRRTNIEFVIAMTALLLMAGYHVLRSQPARPPMHGATLVGKVENCSVYRMWVPYADRMGRTTWITICPQGVTMVVH